VRLGGHGQKPPQERIAPLGNLIVIASLIAHRGEDSMAKSGSTIHLDEVHRIRARDDLWAIRGYAIQAYATLEQGLCILFSNLAGIDFDTAAIIFFRITNTSSRNSILEKLFQKRMGDSYSLFRNSLIAQLRPIDIERNAIVHWNTVTDIGDDENGDPKVSTCLTTPYIYTLNANAPRKGTDDLVDFIEKCTFYSRLIDAFCLYGTEEYKKFNVPEMDSVARAWRDIFQQAIVYPPPKAHPLSLKQPEHDIPPRSSPA
jgi:hypothetical protein